MPGEEGAPWRLGRGARRGSQIREERAVEDG